MKKRYIVITSIFDPAPAIAKLASYGQYQVVVVGDKKTPSNWQFKGVEYLSCSNQIDRAYKINKHLPFNHYCRKMNGYLHAIEHGAEIILDTDDDNIPIDNWATINEALCSNAFSEIELDAPTNTGNVNVYSWFSNQKIWPRGFPLDAIQDPSSIIKEQDIIRRKFNVGIWQGLADGDPDVDAIYRLTRNEPCIFERRDPIVLQEGAVCPFNSQNTLFRSDYFPLLYLPAYVTFRFTDILRGLVAQPILWASGCNLGFFQATVYQERNEHDYMKDFCDEWPCYIHAPSIVERLDDVVKSSNSVIDNLYNAYYRLQEHGIVKSDEIVLLECWLEDMAKIHVENP